MRFFDPRGKDTSDESIWQWHKNVLLELEDGFLDDEEKDHIVTNGAEIILTIPRKEAYFKYAYLRNFRASVEFLFSGNQHPVILDLGCGIGTQSLYFAFMGATVVALDLDATSLDIMRKRISFYEENVVKDKLNIAVHCANAFEFDYPSIPPIDGVYSMFAFNIIQPSSKLISLIVPHMSDTGKFAILDGNNKSWVGRFVPSRKRDVLSPKEMETTLEDHGFAIREHRGGVAIPPSVWPFDYFGLVSRLDGELCKNWFFSISHFLLAEHRG